MKTKNLFLTISAAVLLFACETSTFDDSSVVEDSITVNKRSPKTDSYLVVSQTNKLPDGLEKSISKANGKITRSMPQVGIVTVKSDDPAFISKASKIKGIQSVIPDYKRLRIDPRAIEHRMTAEADNPPLSGDDDFFFDLQWGHDAVDAPEAWEAGYRGKGVQVAVLDGGFDLDHPDLAPNINYDLSVDFTDQGLEYGLPDPFSHGTHVAGTIAAADNGYGTIGIAPEAELILVKVLFDEGFGFDSAILGGMLYSVEVGVDIISMSLGGLFEKSGEPNHPEFPYTASEAAAYKNVYNRVATYANQMGVTVIASAGNDEIDFDKSADLVHYPSDATNVISTSATAPNGWGLDPSTDLDLPAYFYTNYGKSTIDLAGPGGTVDIDLLLSGATATVAGITRPAYVFDFVFSTGSLGQWYWSIGTSMATPHVTGVAALIIGKNGGSMKPSHVMSALKASADDLGKPGNDSFYGAGRVNAYNAVTQ